MVIGVAVFVFAALIPENLQRPVRYHFVGIHVRRCTGTALNHVDNKLRVPAAISDFTARLNYRFPYWTGQQIQFHICPRRTHFDHSQRLDKIGIVRQRDAADIEILQGAHRLDTVEIFRRNLAITEQVVLHRVRPDTY